MEKLRLNPISVPWKISASDEVAIFKYEDDRLELHLMADLLDPSKLDELTENPDFFDAMSIVTLRLVFETVLHFEYSRPQLFTFGLDSKKYDRVVNLSSYDTPAFFQMWADTKSCPDPQIYQVENSDIKKTVLNIADSLAPHWSHWILISHDEIINVAGKRLTWEVIDYLQ